LPRRSRRSRPVTNAHRPKAADENITVDGVAVTDDVLRCMSFPKIPSVRDSRDEGESAHHPTRMLALFQLIGTLSPTCSSRSAGLR
jgi:hypothetical protein